MKNKKYFFTSLIWLAVSTAVLLLDQAVKHMIVSRFIPGEHFGSVPGIADFIYVQNTGAAFSILSSKTPFLSILSVLFCIFAVCFWIIKKPRHILIKASLSALFAGALGNAVDRISNGFVVDFISIKWFDFPVFNIADIAIVLGAIALVVYMFFFDKDGKKTDGATADE